MSIRRQGNSYQVVYRCSGEKNPRTETFRSKEEADFREAEIKMKKKNGTFVPPEKKEKGTVKEQKDVTVAELLEEYMETYGLKKWGPSYLVTCKSLAKNYIIPYIGKHKVCSLSVRDIDNYYTMLLDEPAVVTGGHTDTGAKITAHTIASVHKLLKSVFNKAVIWEYTMINPTKGATLPEAKSVKRDVWSTEEVLKALAVCVFNPLRICLYLAIGCSMRLGEILGLQWNKVHLDVPEPYLEVDRELQRCDVKSVEDLERVSRSTIKFKFPAIMPKKATTILVLKSPKNESSNRKIYLSKTVVNELRKVAAEQEEHKNLMKDQYNDMGMVVAQINGHPYEQNIISKHFKKLIKDHGLRPVVFHSLRHTSTSVKLKLSKGNIKAVQGDTGHAEARMVTDTYAHGFDADRKLIAHEMDLTIAELYNMELVENCYNMGDKIEKMITFLHFRKSARMAPTPPTPDLQRDLS